MPDPRQKRIRELFDAVQEMNGVEQQDYLARNCGSDYTLAGAVWKLLLARQRADGILDTPVVQRKEAQIEPMQAGMRIGPYKILQNLGGGGMGVVYQALRSDGVFDRLSALKVIRPELINSALATSFYAERQILAKLDHPNIARIVDGGTTPDGLPYFVMDYVDGETLHAYCTANELPTEARLRLFNQVCRAVEYLHKNGVVHCDLKPGNMLVDRDSVVKLLDFGIAQLTGGNRGGGKLPLMTPGYASPEQLDGQPATPLSDVYSLGVTLHELLTGYRPDAQPENATKRPMTADLDAIVRNALQPEPKDRYRSVGELRSDIENYLECRPVKARGGSVFYRTGKLVRRRRRTTAAAVVGALVASVLGWQVVLLNQRYEFSLAHEKALEAQIENAKQHLLASNLAGGAQTQDLRAVAEAYRTTFSDAIRVWPGSNDKRRELLKETSSYLMDSGARAGDDTAALEELVNTWVQVANVAGNPGVPNLGDRAAAQEALRQAGLVIATLTSKDADPNELRRLENQVAKTATAVDSERGQ